MTEHSTQSFHRIPKRLRKTLTVDNGKEFSDFKTLEKRTGLDVYFADPYSSWQRGLNENTNGLIRQYILKGTNLRKIDAQIVREVVKRINHRPRKVLDFRTPHEVFYRAVRGAPAT